METYLVVFDCLVINEPHFQFIQADSLDDCWLKAYAISRRPELVEGSFEIYKHVNEEE